MQLLLRFVKMKEYKRGRISLAYIRKLCSLWHRKDVRKNVRRKRNIVVNKYTDHVAHRLTLLTRFPEKWQATAPATNGITYEEILQRLARDSSEVCSQYFGHLFGIHLCPLLLKLLAITLHCFYYLINANSYYG